MKTVPIKNVVQRFQHTGQECPHCEEEAVVHDDRKAEKFCWNCHTVLSKEAQWSENEDDDPWTEFFSHRHENYSGFYGPDRAKHVGGFVAPYEFEKDFDEDRFISDSV